MKTQNPPAPKSLVHLTLNSADSRNSPRTEVSEDIIDWLIPLVSHKGVPPHLPWNVTIRVDAKRKSAVFALAKEGRRLVTGVLAFGSEDDVEWQLALESYESDVESRLLIGDARPPKPHSLPWLSVQLHNGLAKSPYEEIYMLGDFERGMAWAIIEEYWQP